MISPAIPMIHRALPISFGQHMAASSNRGTISWAKDPQSRAYWDSQRKSVDHSMPVLCSYCARIARKCWF